MTEKSARIAHEPEVEHIESHEDKQYALTKVNTLGVDLENRDAIKGDDSDGKIDWTWKQVAATISLAGLYVGVAQIPLYFVGGCLSFIAKDLGGAGKSVWLPVSNTLAIASVAPFTGYLQDIFGRRYIAIMGGLFIMVGIIIVGTAHTFGQGVVGMAIAGSGAAVTELTALAGTAELVPVNRRGVYLALVTGFVFPFVPYILISQLLSTYHTWRWTMWICLIYNFIWFVGILFFYFPKSHHRGDGATKLQIAERIDYMGGALSIIGLTLFLVGLQAGGYDHPWTSAYVLATLIVGIVLIITFVIWEWKFARYPMVPRELFAGQRVVAIAYLVAFIGGMNFYSILNFFPLEFSTVFPPNPVQVGLKGLAPAISIVIGATCINASLSYLKGYNGEIVVASCVMMTAFGGALAAVTPDTPRTFVAMGTIATFGVGGVLVPPATIAITVAPDDLIATCVALSLSVRVVGDSIGYTIYYNIFYNKLTHRLPLDIAGYAIKASLPLTSATAFVTALLTDPAAVVNVPGVTPAVIEAATIGTRWGYAYALKYVWLTSIGFGAASVVAACFLPNIAKYMTNRIAAKISH